MNNQFSENLKKIRKENNLSQEQLAAELGVSRQAISKWESATAYPEMDKIIALCDRFNLNIDDLLHRDIKEVKGEEESKKKINIIFDDFLRFINSVVGLFVSMNFKSKIKCLFEQFVNGFILFVLSMILYGVLMNVFDRLFNFLPDRVFSLIINFLGSILMLGLFIVSVIIITYIFKIRYLDYYEKIKGDSSQSSAADNKHSEDVVENENKIIIRDPAHSEYKFLNLLFKIIIWVIKFFLLFFGMFVVGALILSLIAFVSSFLLYKTGIFFIGLLLSISASSLFAVLLILLILNFVFDRKNDKKKMVWAFVISLLLFGIGSGMACVGGLSFDFVEYDESNFKTVVMEYDMRDNLLVYPFVDYDIQYVESDNSNVKIEYSICKYCELDSHINDDNTIVGWISFDNPLVIFREFIKNVNDKKIIPIDPGYQKIIVYTNKNNIDILKNNWNKYIDERVKRQEEINSCEMELRDLNEQNSALQQQIYDLREQLSNEY